MRNDDEIDALIKELKDLRVQETNLLQRIEEANRQRQDRSNTRDNEDTERDTKRTYQVRDRVYITNQIRKPAFAPRSWTGYNERRATVTKVSGERVSVKTDNGTHTWRAAKNLRLLSP